MLEAANYADRAYTYLYLFNSTKQCAHEHALSSFKSTNIYIAEATLVRVATRVTMHWSECSKMCFYSGIFWDFPLKKIKLTSDFHPASFSLLMLNASHKIYPPPQRHIIVQFNKLFFPANKPQRINTEITKNIHFKYF